MYFGDDQAPGFSMAGSVLICPVPAVLLRSSRPGGLATRILYAVAGYNNRASVRPFTSRAVVTFRASLLHFGPRPEGRRSCPTPSAIALTSPCSAARLAVIAPQGPVTGPAA